MLSSQMSRIMRVAATDDNASKFAAGTMPTHSVCGSKTVCDGSSTWTSSSSSASAAAAAAEAVAAEPRRKSTVTTPASDGVPERQRLKRLAAPWFGSMLSSQMSQTMPVAATDTHYSKSAVYSCQTQPTRRSKSASRPSASWTLSSLAAIEQWTNSTATTATNDGDTNQLTLLTSSSLVKPSIKDRNTFASTLSSQTSRTMPEVATGTDPSKSAVCSLRTQPTRESKSLSRLLASWSLSSLAAEEAAMRQWKKSTAATAKKDGDTNRLTFLTNSSLVEPPIKNHKSSTSKLSSQKSRTIPAAAGCSGRHRSKSAAVSRLTPPIGGLKSASRQSSKKTSSSVAKAGKVAPQRKSTAATGTNDGATSRLTLKTNPLPVKLTAKQRRSDSESFV